MRLVHILVVLSVATPAIAQQRSLDVPSGKLIISDRAIADGMSSARSVAPPAQGSRDSLKNGTIVGAVIGAVVMGTGVGLLCKALQEPSDPSCWGSASMGAAMGAGIGALGGLGIDAMLTRSPRALPPSLSPPKAPPARVTAVRP